MKNKLVVIPTIQTPIARSPGFEKKLLSEYKLDILGLCGFGCRYCSSNVGNYLRINRESFADQTQGQLGQRIYPTDDPALTFVWADILDAIERQLHGKPRTWGAGKTLVFSMLTDGFSPSLVRDGTTHAVLQLLVKHTSFRIRVLTKNSVVGNGSWVSFFARHRDRFVVGLSTGTMDDKWSAKIEVGTSHPTARLRALRALQDAGVPTYGMLCPVFPDVLADDQLEHLIDAINPQAVEHVWSEPFNDRVNWRIVREGYLPESAGYKWFTHTFEQRDRRAWSHYATTLFTRLRRKAEREGWLHKLRYLLYEGDIVAEDVAAYGDLSGVLLQSTTDDDGHSRHPQFSEVQAALARDPRAAAGRARAKKQSR